MALTVIPKERSLVQVNNNVNNNGYTLYYYRFHERRDSQGRWITPWVQLFNQNNTQILDIDLTKLNNPATRFYNPKSPYFGLDIGHVVAAVARHYRVSPANITEIGR